jgi:hypothetical protein
MIQVSAPGAVVPLVSTIIPPMLHRGAQEKVVGWTSLSWMVIEVSGPSQVARGALASLTRQADAVPMMSSAAAERRANVDAVMPIPAS